MNRMLLLLMCVGCLNFGACFITDGSRSCDSRTDACSSQRDDVVEGIDTTYSREVAEPDYRADTGRRPPPDTADVTGRDPNGRDAGSSDMGGRDTSGPDTRRWEAGDVYPERPIPDPPLVGGGSTCEDPFIVDRMPFHTEADTRDATADYFIPPYACVGAAFGHGHDERDQVFAFTPDHSGEVTVVLNMDNSFESVLYIVTDCGQIDEYTCVGASNTWPGAQIITFYAEAGVTYYIVVDGFIGDAGPYELEVW